MSADERQVAVVTGANRGIGREVASQLAERGFAVVLGSRSLVKGEKVAKDLGGHVTACQLDVSDEASVAAMASLVRDEYGRVDVLVNNAAILYDTWAAPPQPISTASARRWRRIFLVPGG